MGTIALVGGDEFRPNCMAMDREILRRVGKLTPRVLILPTAAANEEPGAAAANGVRHFQSLGLEAAALMVVTRADAENDALAARVKDADVIYLTGGDPAYLLETLRHSAVWSAIERLYRQGGAVIGSSAGAMALGAQMRYGPREWVPGLGLAPRVAVLPHHERCAEEEAHDLREALPSGLVLLGIAAAAACINAGNGAWQVAGEGSVCVYGEYSADRYTTGASFELP
jgi:cyanophycinase